MSERWKMLLTSPGWIPLAMVTLSLIWLIKPEVHKSSWSELKDIVKWAWKN